MPMVGVGLRQGKNVSEGNMSAKKERKKDNIHFTVQKEGEQMLSFRDNVFVHATRFKKV